MRFCNHDWTEWQTILIMDGITYQARSCLKCGQVQNRELS